MIRPTVMYVPSDLWDETVAGAQAAEAWALLHKHQPNPTELTTCVWESCLVVRPDGMMATVAWVAGDGAEQVGDIDFTNPEQVIDMYALRDER